MKPAGGPKSTRAGPPGPAPAQQKKSSLSNSKRQDGPRNDGDKRRPAANTRRTTARPEMPRPTTAARIDPPRGDEDQSTDEGEDQDEDSLPPSDWTPPRDEMESAGEREDDMHTSSLPTTNRPEPRDHHHSAGRGEDNDSLPQTKKKFVPLLGRGHRRGPDPHPPPATNDNIDSIEELSPTLVTAIDTSGGSPGRVY